VRRLDDPISAMWVALATTLVVAGASGARAEAADVDPEAVKTLRRTLDYLDGLDRFSVDIENMVDEVLASGQKIQLDVSVSTTVDRPDKLRVRRDDGVISQDWYYDGKTLALYSRSDGYYATAAAPGTIEEMLVFAHDSLGLIAPASDLMYRNAFSLLMQDVTAATVVGKAVIGGVRCDHLAFHRPDVDFQIWVADTGNPLPLKYVVTDTTAAEQPDTISVMSNWNVKPKVSDATFTFVPPKGAKETDFMPLASWVDSAGAGR
jgi:hypothetical protein